MPRDGRDQVRERLEEFHETARRNGERIFKDPTIPIRMLTQQRATFRREDLLKVLHTHTVDAEQFTVCLNAVMACPELVETPSGRYTSHEMLAAERRLLEAADALAQRTSHEVAERHVKAAIARAEQRLMAEASRAAQPAPRIQVPCGSSFTDTEGVLELAPKYWRQTCEQTEVQQRLAANPLRAISLTPHSHEATQPRD